MIEKAERHRLLAEKIGLTFLQIHFLEYIAAYYLVLSSQAIRGMGVDKGNQLIERALKSTFGHTVDKLIKANLFSDELNKRFEKLKDERNWLVHRSCSDFKNAINNQIYFEPTIKRLVEIKDETTYLTQQIDNVC